MIRLESGIAKFVVLIFLAVLIGLGSAGLLDPVKAVLSSDRLTFVHGDWSISVWGALRAVVAIIFLFWIASIVAGIGEKQLKGMTRLRSSDRAILSKAFQLAVYLFLFLVLLDVLGVDFTALAVVGGGLGIGLGFGLQKIAANFISGLILLVERSVEEGDLIELSGGVFGFVRNTGARYTLVECFDSREIMVPNEDFITNRVINWTYTNEQARVEIPIGVSYDSDIEKARELILEAARAHPRCLKEPEPKCFLREFGDSSVNFLLYFWVDDVALGRYEPQSDVMRAIWTSFEEHGITIPFPQRDVHVKAAGETA
jgi:small-conductance mechanosensitive channel